MARKRAKNWDEYAKQMEDWWQGAQYSKTYNPNAEQAGRQRMSRLQRELPAQSRMLESEGRDSVGGLRAEVEEVLARFADDEDEDSGDASESKFDAREQLESAFEADGLSLIGQDPITAEERKKLLAEKEEPSGSFWSDFLRNSGIAWAWANHAMTRPISTIVQTVTPDSGVTGDFAGAWDRSGLGQLNPDEVEFDEEAGWFANTDAALEETLSVGQAITANPFSFQRLPNFNAMPGSLGFGGLNADAPNNDATSEEFQKWATEDNVGRLITGATDFAQEAVVPVELVFGRPLKLGLAAARGSKSTIANQKYLRNALEAHDAGGSTSVGEMRDWLTATTDTKAIEVFLRKKGAGDRADVAHLFAKTNDPAETSLLLRASVWDEEAIKELSEVSPSKALDLVRRNGLDDDLRRLSDWRRKPGETVDDPIQDGWNQALHEDPDFVARVVEDYAARDDHMAEALNVAGSLAGVNRGVSPLKFWEKHRMKQAERQGAAELSGGKSFFQTFKASPASIPVGVVRWAKTEKPSGYVQVKGSSIEGSSREMTAILNDVPFLNGTHAKEFDGFRRQLYDKWAGSAHSDVMAGQAVREIEQAIATQMSKRFNPHKVTAAPGTPEYVEQVAAREAWVQDKMEGVRQLQQQRDAAVKKLGDNGGYWVEGNGSNTQIISTPQYESHIANGVPVLDFRMLEREMSGAIEPWTRRTVDGAVTLNQAFLSVWKPAVLLRLAYPMRNNIDALGRSMALMGTHNVLTFETATNVGKNLGNRVARASGGQARAHARVMAETSDAKRLRNDLAVARQNMSDVDLSPGERRELQLLVDKAQVQLDQAEGRLTAAQARLENIDRHYRSGETPLSLTDASGEIVRMPAAFTGKGGEAARMNSSSASTWQALAGTNAALTQRKFKNAVAMAGTDVDPLNPGYTDALLNLSNNIIRDTGIGMARLRGDSFETFEKWLMTRDGSRSRKFLQESGVDVNDYYGMQNWFDHGVSELERVFPDEMVRATMLERPLTEADLAPMLAKKDQLVPVIGNDIVSTFGAGKSVLNKVADARDAAFKVLGSMPEDAVARWPYYRERYREYMEDFVAGQTVKELPIDRLVKAEHEAHRFALRAVKRDLYTIERKTNLVSAVEQFSPFFEAQMNSFSTWGRIMLNDPVVPGRIAHFFDIARDSGVIDDDGNIAIPSFKAGPVDTETVKWSLPVENVLSIITGGTSLSLSNVAGQVDGEASGAIPALGLVVPSPGPLVTAAMSEAEKIGWLTDETKLGRMVTNYVNPLGPSTMPGSVDQMLPSYVAKLIDGIRAESSGSFDTWAHYVWQQEEVLYRMGERPDRPGAAEIRAKARDLYWTWALGSFVMPGAPKPESHLKFMSDMSRKLTETLGYERGIEAFVQMYGTSFNPVNVRSTKNSYGFPQSQEAFNVLEQNPKLVEQLSGAGMGPEYVALLLGASEAGEYSPSVRRLMQIMKVPGGDGSSVQTPQSLTEKQERLDVADGWSKYANLHTIFADNARLELLKRYGTKNEEEVPHQQLIAFRSEMAKHKRAVVKMIGKSNPVWQAEFIGQKKNERAARAVTALQAVRDDESFWKKAKTDPYWQTVDAYLELRKKFQKRELKKGHNNRLTSNDGKKERLKYETKVNALLAGNVQFKRVYDRWFSAENYWEQTW